VKAGQWTLRKNEETHIDVFEMKGLRKILLYVGGVAVVDLYENEMQRLLDIHARLC